MLFYFCTNEKWYSKAARFFSKEPMTHVALGFFKDELDLVIDCTKPHGKLYHYTHWEKKYRVVDTLELPLLWENELELYNLATKACINQPYDWPAYYFLWFYGLRRFFTGKPLPELNSWAGSGMLCTEIFSPIDDLLKHHNVDLGIYDYAAATPFDIYVELKSQDSIIAS